MRGEHERVVERQLGQDRDDLLVRRRRCGRARRGAGNRRSPRRGSGTATPRSRAPPGSRASMSSVSSRRIGLSAIAAPTSWGRRCAAIGKQPPASAAPRRRPARTPRRAPAKPRASAAASARDVTRPRSSVLQTASTSCAAHCWSSHRREGVEVDVAERDHRMFRGAQVLRDEGAGGDRFSISPCRR